MSREQYTHGKVHLPLIVLTLGALYGLTGWLLPFKWATVIFYICAGTSALFSLVLFITVWHRKFKSPILEGHAMSDIPFDVVVDIETTGLVPEKDHILEVAMVAVNPVSMAVLDDCNVVIRASEEVRSWMPGPVMTMHTENGLLEECFASEITLFDAEAILTDWMNEVRSFHGGDAGDYIPPMIGSSVHFDRAFLRHWMPDLSSLFHRRNIDISSLKEAFRRNAPWVVEEWEDMVSNEAKVHRAMPDVFASLDEYKFYMSIVRKGAGTHEYSTR